MLPVITLLVATSAVAADAPAPTALTAPAVPVAPTALTANADPVAIRYLGHRCFSIQPLRGPSVLIDPYPDVGFPPVALAGGYDVAVLPNGLVGMTVIPRGEFADYDLLSTCPAPTGETRPPNWTVVRRVLVGPETGRESVAIDGVSVRTFRLGERSAATVVAVNGVRIVHLALLEPGTEAKIGGDLAAMVRNADVLILPAGGGEPGAPDAAAAAELARKWAPTQYIIPMMCASPRLREDQRKYAPAEKLAAAVAGKRPVGQAAGNLLLVQRRPPILTLPVPAAVMLMDDRPFRPDPAREAHLAGVRAARQAVWDKVAKLGPAALDQRNALGELPIRYHLEHCIGRDLGDFSRLAARGRPESAAVIEWSARPGPTGYTPRTTGLSAAELALMSRRAAEWGDELTGAAPPPPGDRMPPPPKPPADKTPDPKTPDPKAAPMPVPIPLDDPSTSASEPVPADLRAVAVGLTWCWEHHGRHIAKQLAERAPKPPPPEKPVQKAPAEKAPAEKAPAEKAAATKT